MNPHIAAYKLATYDGIGARTVGRLLSRYGSLQNFLDAPLSSYGRPERLILKALECSCPEAEEQLGRWQEKDHVYSVFDSAYPGRIARLTDPPLLLFVRGALPENWPQPSIVMVGSRRASSYGQAVARRLSCALAESGAAIGSGLAYGIDASSHQGAIQGGGVTWATVAHGVDLVHPKRNSALADQLLASGGAIVSEYPPGTPVQVFQFPARNRIMAALADAVVVVEGAKRSGSLITADVALDLGIPVLAVPGRVGDTQAEAPLNLLRQGAAPAIDAASVLDAVGYTSLSSTPVPAAAPDQYQHLFNAMPESGAIHVDELATTLSRPVTTLLTDLLQLELAGWVEPQPGKYYSRSLPRSN